MRWKWQMKSQPFTENPSLLLRQSVMPWLDRPVPDTLASDLQSAHRAFCWISFLIQNPEILARHVTTSYLHSTLCESTNMFRFAWKHSSASIAVVRTDGVMEAQEGGRDSDLLFPPFGELRWEYSEHKLGSLLTPSLPSFTLVSFPFSSSSSFVKNKN